VKEILGERQTDGGLKYEVTKGKGRETRTIWWYKVDLAPELLEGLLRRFKAGQRWMRQEAGGEVDAAETARRYG